MKISSKIYIICILFIVEHICILGIILFAVSQINHAIEKNNLVYDIAKDISDITMLVNELNGINKKRIIYQWNVKTKEIIYKSEKIAYFFGKKDIFVMLIMNDVKKITNIINLASYLNEKKYDEFLNKKKLLFNNIVLILKTVSSSSNTLLKKSQEKIFH